MVGGRGGEGSPGHRQAPEPVEILQNTMEENISSGAELHTELG